jgi:hypothetical protein
MVMKKVLGLMCMGIGVVLLLVTLMQSKIGEWVFLPLTEVRTFEVQGVETLQIEAEYADLRLVPERRKDIRVEMETSKWHEPVGVLTVSTPWCLTTRWAFTMGALTPCG